MSSSDSANEREAGKHEPLAVEKSGNCQNLTTLRLIAQFDGKGGPAAVKAACAILEALCTSNGVLLCQCAVCTHRLTLVLRLMRKKRRERCVPLATQAAEPKGHAVAQLAIPHILAGMEDTP
eukprot:1369307-Amphidinium_carterae.1